MLTSPCISKFYFCFAASCTTYVRPSLVEADFLDQGDCRLLMRGNLIDWQSVGWERSDLHQDRIAIRG